MQKPFPSYQNVPQYKSSVSNATTAIISRQSTQETDTQELFEFVGRDWKPSCSSPNSQILQFMIVINHIESSG